MPGTRLFPTTDAQLQSEPAHSSPVEAMTITVCDPGAALALRHQVERRATQLDLLGNANQAFADLAKMAREHLTPDLLLKVGGINSPFGAPLHYLEGLIPPETPTHIADLMLIAVVEGAGSNVFTLAEQHDGAIVHPITPHPGHEHEQSSLGVDPFDYHSDDPMFERALRVQGIHLLGRVNKHHCTTTYMPVDRIMEGLDAETTRVLSQPRFEHLAPASFRLARPFVRTGSVLEAGTYGYEIAVELGAIGTADIGDDLVEALHCLTQVIREAEPVEISIEPLCLLSLSNTRGLHSRGQITGKRHLRRVYSRLGLQALWDLTLVSADSRVFSAAQLLDRRDTAQAAA